MANQHVIEATDESFETLVAESQVPVLVDFTATWCGPCQKLSPIVEKLAQDFAGTYTVAKLDIDANPGITSKLGVRGVPTVMVFKGGKKTGQHVGLINQEKLLELLSS